MELIKYFEEKYPNLEKENKLFHKLLYLPYSNLNVQYDYLTYLVHINEFSSLLKVNKEKLLTDTFVPRIFEDLRIFPSKDNLLNQFSLLVHIDNKTSLKSFLTEKVNLIKSKELIEFLSENYQKYYKSLAFLKQVKKEIKNLIDYYNTTDDKILKKEKAVFYYLNFLEKSIPEINIKNDSNIDITPEVYDFLKALFYYDLISDVFMYYSYPEEIQANFHNDISEYLYYIRILAIKLLNEYLEATGKSYISEKEGYIYNNEEIEDIALTFEESDKYEKMFKIARKNLTPIGKVDLFESLLDIAYSFINKDRNFFATKLDISRNLFIIDYLNGKTNNVLLFLSYFLILNEEYTPDLEYSLDLLYENFSSEKSLKEVVKTLYDLYDEKIKERITDKFEEINDIDIYVYSFLSLLLSLDESIEGEIERGIFTYLPYFFFKFNDNKNLLEKFRSILSSSFEKDLKELSLIDSKIAEEISEITKILGLKFFVISAINAKSTLNYADTLKKMKFKGKNNPNDFKAILMTNLKSFLYLINSYLKIDLNDIKSTILYKMLKDTLVKGILNYFLYLLTVTKISNILHLSDVINVDSKSEVLSVFKLLELRINPDLEVLSKFLEDKKFTIYDEEKIKDTYKKILSVYSKGDISYYPVLLNLEKESNYISQLDFKFKDDYLLCLKSWKEIINIITSHGNYIDERKKDEGLGYLNYILLLLSSINAKTEYYFNPLPLFNFYTIEEEKVEVLEKLNNKSVITYKDLKEATNLIIFYQRNGFLDAALPNMEFIDFFNTLYPFFFNIPRSKKIYDEGEMDCDSPVIMYDIIYKYIYSEKPLLKIIISRR